MLIFRDEERGNKASVAFTENLKKNKWSQFDLAARELGSWEPSFDEYLWKQKKELHLFVQKTDQTDAEGISRMEPQMISVLEWKMVKKIKYTPQ